MVARDDLFGILMDSVPFFVIIIFYFLFSIFLIFCFGLFGFSNFGFYFLPPGSAHVTFRPAGHSQCASRLVGRGSLLFVWKAPIGHSWQLLSDAAEKQLSSRQLTDSIDRGNGERLSSILYSKRKIEFGWTNRAQGT